MFKAINRIFILLGKRGTLQVGTVSLVLLSGTFLQFLPILVVLPIIRIITRPGEPLSPRLLEIIPDGWHGFINDLLTQTDYQTLVIGMVLFAVVVQLVEGFASIWLNNFRHSFLFRKKLGLSKEMFRRYLDTPRISHRDPVNDIEDGSGSLGAILGSIMGIFQNGILFTASFATIVFLFPLPGLAGFVFLIITALFVLSVFNPMLKVFGEQKIRELEKRRYGLGDEMMAIKEIKVLGREKRFFDSFVENARIRERNARIRAVIDHSSGTIFGSLRFLSLLIGFFVALLQGLSGTALVSFLFAYTIVIMRAGGYLGAVIGSVIGIKTTSSRFNMCYETLERLKVSEVEQAGAPLEFRESIELKEASYRYPAARGSALEQVSLRIRKGECIGIIGRNGSGKTTLIDVITGLARPSDGMVLIDGVELAPGDVRDWQRRIGYVVQNPHVIDNTVFANIALGLSPEEVDDKRMQEVIKITKLDEVIRELPDGLQTVVGQKGSRLSGGQAQRLGIARALYRETEVIILDEATKSIDPQNEADIIDNIAHRRDARTIIMVTHKPQTLRRCDRVYVLEGGRIAEQGSYREVVGNAPALKRTAQDDDDGEAPVVAPDAALQGT